MDLCIVEDNEKDLKRLRCVSYNTMNTACLNFAAKNGLRDWHFNWRQNTQCSNKKNIYILNLDVSYFIKFPLKQ
jgi:hypothetical protein